MYTNFVTLNNHKTNKLFKVAIYIRLSREDGDKEESSSITNQRAILKRYIEENKEFVLVDEYVDDGFTGTNFNRPGFQKLLRDLKAKKVDTVITKDLSRLGRDYIDTGYYVQKFFPENNIRYISILDNIDTMEDAGMNDIAPFKSIINDMYVKDISKKIKSALKERKTAGNFLATTAPYGYMKNPENKYQLIINEKEAQIVKRIFNLYLSGNGLTKISQILTDEGVPVPGISRNIGTTRKTMLYDSWKQTTISRILKNQVYIGNLEQFKRRNINYKSKVRITVPKEDRVICKNTHEAIIDKDTFYRVQELISGNSSFKGTKHDYLFKGLLYCAECGAKLYLTYSNYAFKKYGEYRYTTICYTHSKQYRHCTRHSNKIDVLEKVLTQNIKNVCSKYINENLEQELIDVAKKNNEKDSFISQYETQIAEIEKKLQESRECIRSLYADKVKGILSENDFVILLSDFEKEVQNLNKAKDNLNIKIGKTKEMKNNNTEIETLARKFIALETPTKELLNMLIDKVTITEDNEITIYFKFKELDDISNIKGYKINECKTLKGNTKKVC